MLAPDDVLLFDTIVALYEQFRDDTENEDVQRLCALRVRAFQQGRALLGLEAPPNGPITWTGRRLTSLYTLAAQYKATPTATPLLREYLVDSLFLIPALLRVGETPGIRYLYEHAQRETAPPLSVWFDEPTTRYAIGQPPLILETCARWRDALVRATSLTHLAWGVAT